jgi:NADPH:quinone reductase-like Zn-dependent oxidoreductase
MDEKVNTGPRFCGPSQAMRAARIHRTGGPSVLKVEDVAMPRLAKGTVLIQVHAASVNPVDTKIRAGKFKLFRPKLPAIIGRDVAGVVCWTDATSGFRNGEPVFGMLDYDRGAYATYALGSRRELARRPKAVSELAASCLGVAAMTAWQALFDHGSLRRGQRVLIHGAAGGVGHFAVQFAKARGATVVATAGRRDLAWVRRLGADQVIDYKARKFEDETSAIDLVLDLVGGDTLKRSWAVLKPRGGAIVSTLEEPSRAKARRHHARGMRMIVVANRRQLAEIARLVVAKKVRVTISREFSLEKIRAAHVLAEKGHFRGKIGIRM